MSSHTLTTAQLRGIALTIVIGATFAGIWGLSGSASLPGSIRIITMGIVIIVTLVWFFLAFRWHRAAEQLPDAPTELPNPFRTRAYWIAVIGQGIGIPVASRLLITSGYPDAVISAVAAIVGLHFFGLIPAFRSWAFAVVGGAMALLALLSLAVAPQVTWEQSGEMVGMRTVVVGLGCALILWGGILPIAMQTRRQLDQVAR